MRLLTHNTLRCARKDVTIGFPLRIEGAKVEVRQSPCNTEFIASLIETIDWGALCAAAASLGLDSLPPQLTEELVADETFLHALHHILMDVHVTEGVLICPESGQAFPIHNGVPNMMLDEAVV